MFSKIVLLIVVFSHLATAGMPTAATSDCVSPQKCHVHPPSCRSSLSSCKMIVWWKKKDSTAFSVGLYADMTDIARNEGYVAIGYSLDGNMIGSKVDTCSKVTGFATVGAFTIVGKSPFSPQLTAAMDSTDNRVTNLDTATKIISCKYDRKFTSPVTKYSLFKAADFIDSKYHILAAYGPSTTGALQKHIGYSPLPVTTTTTTTPIVAATTSTPSKCSISSANLVVITAFPMCVLAVKSVFTLL